MKLYSRLANVLFVLCVLFVSARAATFTVSNSNDSGAGSLRQAILEAEASAGADTIDILSTGTLSLASALPTITQSLTINGGQGDFQVNANAAPRRSRRVFTINAGGGVIVNINDLSLTGGYFETTYTEIGGGGIYMSGGATLNLTNVSVTRNRTVVGLSGIPARGGVYVSGGALNVVNSRIRENQSDDSRGGGIYVESAALTMTGSTILQNFGGGIAMSQGSARIENSTINDNYNSLGSAGLQCSAATLLMSNVTFSTNAPANRGGGLFLSACDATLRNVTIAGGSASVQGGGIYSNSDSVVRLANTIIADNSAPSGADFYAANTTVTLLTNNIIEGGITDGGGNTVNGAGTIQQIDPQLAALAENGGTVKTQALGATSPAIDAGTNGEALDTQTVPQALMTDARGTGFARVRNGDGNGSAIVDLGAFEYIALPTAATVTIGGRVLTNSRRGLSNALVYLTDFSGDMRTARTNSLGYYRFNDIVAGQSVTITVVSKRYQFAPQVVNVNEEMSGLNFLAEQ